jgi:ABC-type nitrate/sulfonate/bicarbonate transport system substrate-binding protein
VTAAAPELESIKVALTQKDLLITHMPFFVAIEKGFYAKQGLKVELVSFAGGGDTIRGVTSKAVSFAGMASTDAAMIAFSQGVPIRFIAGQAYTTTALNWIVKTDSPYKTIRDLRGQKIGFTRPGAVGEFYLQQILKKEGLSTSVTLVPVGDFAQNWTAAETGQIAAAQTNDPLQSKLIKQGKARILFRSMDYIKETANADAFAMADYLEKNPETVRKYLRAMKEATAYIYQNPDEAIAIYSKATKTELDIARISFNNLAPDAMYIYPRMAGLNYVNKSLEERGIIKKAIDLDKFVDRRFLPPEK